MKKKLSKSQIRRLHVQFEKDFPHGYICADCAYRKEGIPVPWPVTVQLAECGYCKQVKGLVALTDYEWPKYKRKAVWD